MFRFQQITEAEKMFHKARKKYLKIKNKKIVFNKNKHKDGLQTWSNICLRLLDTINSLINDDITLGEMMISNNQDQSLNNEERERRHKLLKEMRLKIGVGSSRDFYLRNYGVDSHFKHEVS